MWNLFTFGFMGVAFVTQLLSMLGVVPAIAEINVMVWMYGGLVDMVLGLVSSLVAMYAYDAYW